MVGARRFELPTYGTQNHIETMTRNAVFCKPLNFLPFKIQWLIAAVQTVSAEPLKGLGRASCVKPT